LISCPHISYSIQEYICKNILIHISLGWQCLGSARQWFMRLEPCWIYIWNGWYYRWMFKTCLINISNIHFLKVAIFYWYLVSKNFICLSVLCTSISTIFLKGF
jgi:hypothetical protein